MLYFYKNQLQLLEEIPEELTTNQGYIQTIMKNEEFEECRKNTKFDEVLFNLAIQQGKVDFIRRFAEGQTMMFDKKGKDTLGKGANYFSLDQSSSMRKLDTQSKGFALAMMSIAKKQKKEFCVYHIFYKCKSPNF